MCYITVVRTEDLLFAERFPTWRGRIHAWAFLCSVPAGVALLLAVDSTKAEVAVAIYAVSLTSLFGVSAAYHRVARSATARRRMRRLDHAMIYVLIAGTYTPVCVLALPSEWGIPVLAAVWAGAAAGAAIKSLGIRRLLVLANALYIVLGWAAVVALPVVAVSIPPIGLVFMVIGGIAYTAGAVVLLRRKPDPRPEVFGYHEFWHVCTVIGAASHYVMVRLIAV